MSRLSSIAPLLRVAKLAAFTWACLLLIPHTGPAAAQDPRGDMPYRRVYVPRANVREMAEDHMPLRRAEFEDLIEILSEAAAEPPGLAAPIPRAVYHARLEGNRLGEGSAVWRVEPAENAPSILNLSDVDLPILNPYWNGNPENNATVGWSRETGLVLLTPSAGDLHFGWSHVGKISHRGIVGEGPLHFELHLPPAGRTTLLLDAPPGWELRTSQGSAVDTTLSGAEAAQVADPLLANLAAPAIAEGWRRWRIDVADATEVELTAVPISSTGPRSLILLDQLSYCRIAESHVELRCELRLNVQNQPRDHLVLELDPRLSLKAAQMGDTPLEWHRAEAVPQEQGQGVTPANLVVLDLPELLGDGPRTIELAAIAPLVTGEPWTVPTIQPRGVFWQQSLVEIQVEGNLELAQLSAGECQQIETSFSAGPQGGERHKFQCAGQRDEITLMLRRREATIVGETAARLFLGPSTIRGTLLATLAVEHGLAFELRGTIPAGWQIEEIESELPETIEYWELQPGAEGAQSLLVRLREPLRVGAPLAIVLRGERRMSDTRPFPLSELRMLEVSGAEISHEHYYVGAEPPSRPTLSGYALPVQTVTQPADVAASQLLGVATGDLSFDWQAFEESRVPPQIDAQADPVPFRYDAAVTIRVQDDVLLEHYAFACSPDSAEVGTLLVQFNQPRETSPTWTLGGEAESALTARKLSAHEQERLSTQTGEVWEVQLRRPRKAPFRLEATRSVPRTALTEAALAALPEASPQNCEVRVLRETAEELAVLASPDLARIPLTPPVELEYPTQIAAYRYQPERDLIAMNDSVLSIADAESSPFHLAWIRTLRLETLAFDGERIEHRVRCEVENYGARQLAFRLPPGVQLAELLVDGRPLPDAVGSDPAADTMLALPANRRIVSVEFRMIGQSGHDLGRQRVTAPLPHFEAPVLDATWTVWCPPGHEVLELVDAETSKGLAEPGWRHRLFGPLARSSTSLDREAAWSESASTRRQVEWLLEDLVQAEAAPPGTFWNYLARHVQSPPAGEANETRLPVLIDRASLDLPLEGDPTGTASVLRRLGLAVVVHPRAILLTDPSCDWLSKQCLRSGGRANVWEITCNPKLAEVEQALQGSTRFVPIEQWSAELTGQTAGGRLAPAGWSAVWFELPTEKADESATAEVVLYRPASVLWLGWLGLLLTLPVIALLCARAPSAAVIMVGVLGAVALVVPAWLVPITSLTLLGALGGIVLWMTLRAPRALSGGEPNSSNRSHSTSVLKVPSTIGFVILAMALGGLLMAGLAAAQQPTSDLNARSAGPAGAGMAAPPERASIIYPLDGNNEFSGPYVYVPEWYYQELFRRTSRLAREPGPWLLHSAQYTATPAMHSEEDATHKVEVVANYVIETLVADAEVTLPMPYGLLAEHEGAVQLDGRPLRVARAEHNEGLRLKLAIPGRHRLELSFALPIEENRSGRVAALPIPPLAAARLEWSSRSQASVPESVHSLGGIVERGSARLEAELGPVSMLELGWPPESVELAGRIQTEQLLWLSVKPGSVVADARFRVRTDEPVSSLHFYVDRRLQRSPLPEGSPIASVSMLGDGEREMVIEFKEPLLGDQTFDLSFLVRDASGVGNLHLPWLELRGGSGQVRAVGITLDPTIAYVSHAGESLEAFPPADFVTRWGGGVVPPQWAFDLGADGNSWSLATRRREPITSGGSQLDLVCGAEKLEITYQAELATTSGVVFQHRLQLPADMQVEEFSIKQGGREQVTRWTLDQQGLLTAFLAGPISGNHELAMRGHVPVAKTPKQNLPVVSLTTASLTNSEILVIRAYDATLVMAGASGVEPIPNSERAVAPSRGKLVGAFRVPIGSGQLQATITPNHPRVVADSDLILLSQGDGQWQALWRCFLNIEEGQLDALRLLAPANWEGRVEISLEGEQAWSATASPEQKLLTFYPHVPWKESAVLELTAPLTRRPSRPVEAPHISLLEVDAWEARLVVPRRIESLDLSWELQKVRSVALPPHSAELFEDITQWNAYEAIGEPYRALHRTGSTPIGVPEVRLADFYVWWQQHGEGHGVARFDLSPAGNLVCHVRAPATCEIVAARVEGVPVNLRPVGGEQNVWELELSSSQLPQRIEVVFQGKLATSTGNGWNLIAPTIASEVGDLEVAETLWTVVGPEGLLPNASAENRSVSLQQQQMARVEALAELVGEAETTALALPKDDTANWYALWARRLAAAQRELMLAPPLPQSLTEADRARLAEIENAQSELAERLEIESQRIRAVSQAARMPTDAPRWISLGWQLRPSQRYMFEGEHASLQLADAPPATSTTLQRMLALALWIILSACCWALARGAALAGVATRWPGLWVVLAGVLWMLWLSPFWLGGVLILLGLWAAVRGERPPTMRRQSYAS